MIKTHYKKKII